MDSTNCNPPEGSLCTTPIKSKENPGKLQKQQMCSSYIASSLILCVKLCLCCYIITGLLTSECNHAGLVPESPSFFNSSPFKVLSPQPPKFLKSLLPVKEENKAKKVLEARPLLGQEVRRINSLFLKRGEFMSLFLPCCSNISLFCQSSVKPHFHILPSHLSHQIAFPQHGTLIDIDNNY